LQPGSGRRSYERYRNILKAIRDLKTSPHGWPTGPLCSHRERPVEGHRIFYRTLESEQRIKIFRVFGPYQNRSAS